MNMYAAIIAFILVILSYAGYAVYTSFAPHVTTVEDQIMSIDASTGAGQSSVTTQIYVSAPRADATINPPITIHGEAIGPWYFEGSFPVSIFDNNGTEIGHGMAVATMDWMTEEFVPFTATIDFTAPNTPIGVIRLFKSNPSGLPAGNAQLDLPIRF